MRCGEEGGVPDCIIERNCCIESQHICRKEFTSYLVLVLLLLTVLLV